MPTKPGGSNAGGFYSSACCCWCCWYKNENHILYTFYMIHICLYTYIHIHIYIYLIYSHIESYCKMYWWKSMCDCVWLCVCGCIGMSMSFCVQYVCVCSGKHHVKSPFLTTWGAEPQTNWVWYLILGIYRDKNRNNPASPGLGWTCWSLFQEGAVQNFSTWNAPST